MSLIFWYGMIHKLMLNDALLDEEEIQQVRLLPALALRFQLDCNDLLRNIPSLSPA